MASQRKVICALDTSRKDEAIEVVKRFSGKIGGFKIGHALTMPYGLSVVDELMQAGAGRIFLDLKFHDIPNSVALAVREAIKHGVWMITLHSSGGPAMMTAAVEEVHSVSEEKQPILLAVSVLTSLDQHILTNHLGCTRTVEEQMLYLSKLAVECGIDGCVTSPEEVKAVRQAIGRAGVIVTPGVRRPGVGINDHNRSGSATQALEDGADYLVIGRGLMDAQDPDAVLAAYGLLSPRLIVALVSYEPKEGGLTNMARDRMLVLALQNHPWAARIYDWDRPWATLGRFQTPEKDLQQNTRIPWIIRPTGGRGVLHGHDVTIGLAVRLSELERLSGVSQTLLSRSTTRVYRLITRPIIEALQAIGIPAVLGEELKNQAPKAEAQTASELLARWTSPMGNSVISFVESHYISGKTRFFLQGSIPARLPDVHPEDVFAGSAQVIPTRINGKDLAEALSHILTNSN